MANGGMANIEHVVVVALENRSFDNMVGWLYSARGNQPPINLPPLTPGSTPTYEGLKQGLSNPGPIGQAPVTVQYGASGPKPGDGAWWLVPKPDPQEQFDHMLLQLFQYENPGPEDLPTMLGFVQDYATVSDAPSSIMQCFTPVQVPVISALAQNYAICDRWFASVPCQTWPNRAFLHAGTSCGRVNNCDGTDDNCVPNPAHYDTRTIFNVLDDVGESWRVYNDSVLMSLTRLQFFTHLGDPRFEPNFRLFGQFLSDAKAGTLP